MNQISAASDRRLLAFFEGRGQTGHGREIEDIVHAPDIVLEADHLYIQWLFPTAHRSAVNPEAPLLNASALRSIQASPTALANFRRGLDRLRAFYARNDHWLRRRDHNHSRITRIIEASGLILDPEAAEDFLAFVIDRYHASGSPISPKAVRIWQERLDAIRKNVTE
ncbi:MAG: hypothetical protein GC208_00855 [Alphaproteobacteria bacterium]|nr:hypothetical protein [Alphaproteobacteria bacterium]